MFHPLKSVEKCAVKKKKIHATPK